MPDCDSANHTCAMDTGIEATASQWAKRLYAGVNFSIPGTGGESCLLFVDPLQQYAETAFAFVLSVGFILYTSQKVSLPNCVAASPKREARSEALERPWLSTIGHGTFLTFLCLSFGVEVYCKLRDGAVVWLLNICHLVTLGQIVLFASPQRRWVTGLFRIIMHSLHGPFFALIFPVTNTRLLAFEYANYYIQHVLILTGPLYLLAKGGVYSIEPYSDFHWPVLACGIIFFIYWVPVQILCWVTHVNINNMICPAISDPFYGPNYRQWAMLHSALFIAVFGKIYSWLGHRVLSTIKPGRPLEENIAHVKSD